MDPHREVHLMVISICMVLPTAMLVEAPLLAVLAMARREALQETTELEKNLLINMGRPLGILP